MNPIDPKRRLPHPRRKPPGFPRELGDFRLVRKIGGGGASEVFLAEQVSLGRRVALKLIRPGSLFFTGARDKLLAEARAAARISHPAICPIFEAGEAGGIPFLVMPFIEGENLAAWIRKRGRPGDRESRNSVLSILAETARAIHAAHEAGLVHGDIKPSNILVTPNGRPVILDFGIAGHGGGAPLGDGGFLGFMGTPGYMPPERLRLRPAPPTPQGDVYSLGVTLYECLTGRMPFQGPTLERIRENILSGNYADPRALNPSIPKDLKVVVGTAMEEDPAKRYQGTLELAGELERVRRGEPIQARPPSAVQRSRRWIGRNPLLAGTLILLVLALGLTLSLLEDLGAAWTRNENLLQKTQALALARASAQAFGTDQVLSLLLARRALEKAVLPQTLSQIQSVLAGIREKAIFAGHEGIIKTVIFSPNGRWLLTRTSTGTVRTWALDGGPIGKIGGRSSFLLAAGFVPPGDKVLTVDRKGRATTWTLAGHRIRSFPTGAASKPNIIISGKSGVLLAWKPGGKAFITGLSGRKPVPLPGSCVPGTRFAFSPRGDFLLRWDPRDGFTLFSPAGRLLGGWPAPGIRVRCLSISGDGKKIMAGLFNGEIRIWDRDGRLLKRFKAHRRRIFLARFSPDSRRVLSAGNDRTVRLWNLVRDREEWVLGDRAGVLGARFSPSGREIVVIYPKQPIKILSLHGDLVVKFTGHQSTINGAAFSPNGEYIATASSDRTARVWSIRPCGYPFLDHRTHSGKKPRVTCGAFVPHGGNIVTVSTGGRIMEWSADGRLLASRLFPKSRFLAFSPDGKSILVTDDGGYLHLFDRCWNRKRTFRLPGKFGRIAPPSFSPDGSMVLACKSMGMPRVWTVEGRLLHVFPAKTGSYPSLDFSPDGEKVLFILGKNRVQVWTLHGKRLLSFLEKGKTVTAARFDPRSGKILTAMKDGLLRLRDIQGRLLAVFPGHTREVTWIEFSPDGNRVLTASKDGTARVWTREGKTVQVLRGHAERLTCARFSPPGDRVLTCSSDGTARIWELRPRKILEWADRLCIRDFSSLEKREYAHFLGE